jgi:dTMP kinase
MAGTSTQPFGFMSLFITFEGIEGSGKTTQLLRLLRHLQKLGHQAVATREPGGCTISDAIRKLLLAPQSSAMASQTELLLYSAARAQHVVEFIRPNLAGGKIVLCDRFADATTVYQGAGRGLEMVQLGAINSYSADGLTPDLTLLLDYPAEEGLQRARARNRSGNMESEGRFELEALSFHQRIRQGYLDLAATEERIQIVNALGSEDEVADRIAAVVDRFLACRRSA